MGRFQQTLAFVNASAGKYFNVSIVGQRELEEPGEIFRVRTSVRIVATSGRRLHIEQVLRACVPTLSGTH